TGVYWGTEQTPSQRSLWARDLRSHKHARFRGIGWECKVVSGLTRRRSRGQVFQVFGCIDGLVGKRRRGKLKNAGIRAVQPCEHERIIEFVCSNRNPAARSDSNDHIFVRGEIGKKFTPLLEPITAIC